MREVLNADNPVKHYQPARLGNTLLVIDERAEIETTPLRPAGCWSELSSCAVQDQVYLEALKSYAQVYAAYQDYLTPEDPVGRHDYSLGVSATEEHVQLGLLSKSVRPATVTDDEIDGCGYLGWLRH